MVAAARGGGFVFRGGDARKGTEFVHEVGLIGVAMLGCEGAPVDGGRLTDGAQNRLETADAREAFRREADVGGEAAGEGFGLHAEAASNSGDRNGLTESCDRPRHGRIGRRVQMAEEPGFEDGKFLVRGARFEQALAKEMAVGAPEVLKPDDLVAGLAQGQGKKGRGGAGAKLHGGEPSKIVGIEDSGARVRTGEDCARMAVRFVAGRTRVGAKFVLGEVDHEVRLSGRNDTLQAEGQVYLVVVERMDKGAQCRRLRAHCEAGHTRQGTRVWGAGNWETVFVLTGRAR